MKILSTKHLALSTLLLAGGCWTPSYYVDVYLSPLLKETYKVYPSVEVDIVGADKNDAERLEACDVDEYFEVDDPLRMSTPHAQVVPPTAQPSAKPDAQSNANGYQKWEPRM